MENIKIFKSVTSSMPTEPDSMMTSITSHKNKYLSKERNSTKFIECKGLNTENSSSTENIESNIFESKYKNEIAEYEEQSVIEEQTAVVNNENFSGILVSVSGTYHKESKFAIQSQVTNGNKIRQKKLSCQLPSIIKSEKKSKSKAR